MSSLSFRGQAVPWTKVKFTAECKVFVEVADGSGSSWKELERVAEDPPIEWCVERFS